MRPCSLPGRTVSSTASVTPSSSIAERTGGRDRVGDHRVVVAAEVEHARAELRVRADELVVLLARMPRSVRSPFTSTASGSSASISAIAPAFITLGYGRLAGLGVQDRAELLGRPEPAALDLAEVHVVDGCERRELRARRPRRASSRRAGSSSVASAPSTASGYSVAGSSPVSRPSDSGRWWSPRDRRPSW